MLSNLKREVYPLTDWSKFLKEGKFEFDSLINEPSTPVYQKSNFVYRRTIGKGGFGRVVLAKLIVDRTLSEDEPSLYAVKILDVARIVKNKTATYVKAEKRIMMALNFPLCIELICTFKDYNCLYLVLPVMGGKDLYQQIRKRKRLDENASRFYGAQVLLAIEYLHHLDVMYRDLKPENILLANDGYLKLTDYGFSKIVKTRTYTICGTPDYLAPEVILSQGYGKAADWWAFGVLLYELAAGRCPFASSDTVRTYEKIVAVEYRFPKHFSIPLRKLILNMLQSDLSRRYGNLKNGVLDIKDHEFFKVINFISLVNKKMKPPFLPSTKWTHEVDEKAGFPKDESYLRSKELKILFKEFSDWKLLVLSPIPWSNVSCYIDRFWREGANDLCPNEEFIALYWRDELAYKAWVWAQNCDKYKTNPKAVTKDGQPFRLNVAWIGQQRHSWFIKEGMKGLRRK